MKYNYTDIEKKWQAVWEDKVPFFGYPTLWVRSLFDR